jgi:hypothetical protein
MDEIEASKYKISIPFGTFLTAISILIAADFILLQLWFNFQPEPQSDQVLESISIGTIIVSYFVVVSIVSMIIAILDRIGNEVKGRPIILFLFSLFFTMCFVFQSIVTLAIKIGSKLPPNTTIYNHSDFVYFWILLGIALPVTIGAILKPEWWDNLFWSFKKRIYYLMLAILGILIGVTGGVFLIAGPLICHGTIIGMALIAVSLIALIIAYCCCMKKCQNEDK